CSNVAFGAELGSAHTLSRLSVPTQPTNRVLSMAVNAGGSLLLSNVTLFAVGKVTPLSEEKIRLMLPTPPPPVNHPPIVLIRSEMRLTIPAISPPTSATK